jgi:hypothetical protein
MRVRFVGQRARARFLHRQHAPAFARCSRRVPPAGACPVRAGRLGAGCAGRVRTRSPASAARRRRALPTRRKSVPSNRARCARPTAPIERIVDRAGRRPRMPTFIIFISPDKVCLSRSARLRPSFAGSCGCPEPGGDWGGFARGRFRSQTLSSAPRGAQAPMWRRSKTVSVNPRRYAAETAPRTPSWTAT